MSVVPNSCCGRDGSTPLLYPYIQLLFVMTQARLPTKLTTCITRYSKRIRDYAVLLLLQPVNLTLGSTNLVVVLIPDYSACLIIGVVACSYTQTTWRSAQHALYFTYEQHHAAVTAARTHPARRVRCPLPSSLLLVVRVWFWTVGYSLTLPVCLGSPVYCRPALRAANTVGGIAVGATGKRTQHLCRRAPSWTLPDA